MRNKKSSMNPIDAPNTILGQGVVLEAARLSGNESVRIDGEYRGNIDIEGSLVLGETGSVVGDIIAKYIVIAGNVNGNIHCDTMLHFAPTARVTGDIEAQSLIVDEGSQISGHYYVGEFSSTKNAKQETINEVKKEPAKNNKKEPAKEYRDRSYDDDQEDIID